MKSTAKLTAKQKEAVLEQARQITTEKHEGDLATAAGRLSMWLENPDDGETFITKLTFKPNWGEEGDMFVIVNATIGGVKRVTFHGGSNWADTIIGFVKRLRNGSLKWREDVPYDKR